MAEQGIYQRLSSEGKLVWVLLIAVGAILLVYNLYQPRQTQSGILNVVSLIIVLFSVAMLMQQRAVTEVENDLWNTLQVMMRDGLTQRVLRTDDPDNLKWYEEQYGSGMVNTKVDGSFVKFEMFSPLRERVYLMGKWKRDLGEPATRFVYNPAFGYVSPKDIEAELHKMAKGEAEDMAWKKVSKQIGLRGSGLLKVLAQGETKRKTRFMSEFTGVR